MRAGWLGAILMVFTWSLTTHGKYSVSGDEPHHLMISHSIITDGDLDLANNYAQDDGRFFGHPGLEVELHAVPARGGRFLSIHDIGTGVALAPVYLAASQLAARTPEPLLRRFRMDRGLFTYSIVGLFLIAVTTTGMVLVAEGLAAATGRRSAALLVLVAGLSPPIVSHAFLVFPEALALFVTSLAVWLSLKRPGPRDPAALMIVLLLLGLLPWTHHKYLVYGPGLLFVTVWQRQALVRSLTRVQALIGITAFSLPQLALHVWTWQSWGRLGGALTPEGLPFSWPALEAGLAGLWIDRQSGLLAYAPIYWLLPVCVGLCWRRAWPFLVPAALLYVPAAAYVTGWWAGFAPAARYLVPALPLLLVPFAEALRYRTIQRAALLLCIPQFLIDAVVWQFPRALWPTATGNPALDRLGPAGRIYEFALAPVRTEGVTIRVLWIAIGWGLLVAALIVYVKYSAASVESAADRKTAAEA